MAEIPQAERLLRILLNLSSGIRYSADEIMDRYGITKRTFYRDRENLLNIGFTIEQEQGRYWIDKMGSPFKEIHQLPYFTEEEAWIMRQAIHSIDENNQLKINLVEKLYSLYKFGKVAEVIVRKEQSENIHRLVEAMREQRQVVLHDYHSSNSNSIQNRRVEPFDFTANYIAVWAYDCESQTSKTFKTARIRKVSISEVAYQFSDQHKSQPLDVFRISGAEQVNVKLKLNLRAYSLIKEEYPLSEKHLGQLDDYHWFFEGPVSSFDGVGRFILGLPDEVEILSPRALKDFIKDKLKILTKKLNE